MMDDYELTLTSIIERAERLHRRREVVSRAPDGEVHRTTYGAVVDRARRAASALRGPRRSSPATASRRCSGTSPSISSSTSPSPRWAP